MEMPMMPKPPTHATRIASRSPEWKFHKSLGQAKNAVGYWLLNGRARGGEIYELIDDEWQLLYFIPPGTAREDLPWRKS